LNAPLFKKCKAGFVYRTDTAADSSYSMLSRSIAGRKILEIGKELSNNELKIFLELATNFESYGDFGPIIRPDYAIELVYEEDIYVLNYDSDIRMVNFSSQKWSLVPGVFKYTKPTVGSPELIKFLESVKP
jgi:hypothetical protein